MSEGVFLILLILFVIMLVVGLCCMGFNANDDFEVVNLRGYCIGIVISVVAIICGIVLWCTQHYTCDYCGYGGIGDKYCEQCGADLHEAKHRMCPVCNKTIHNNDEYCGNCGTKLKEN